MIVDFLTHAIPVLAALAGGIVLGRKLKGPPPAGGSHLRG